MPVMQRLRHFLTDHPTSPTSPTKPPKYTEHRDKNSVEIHSRDFPYDKSVMTETLPPKLFITADTLEFDPEELDKWTAEGYEVHYVPTASLSTLENLADSLESDEKYCIIAFGTTATIALEFATSPIGQLSSLVAYYPSGLPTREISPQIKRVILHLADSQPFGPPSSPHVKVRVYQDTKPGFAERVSVHYNTTSANLAYTRTLGALRETVGPEIDLEEIWGEHLLYEFVERDVDKTMATMVSEPYVNHIPTITGGIGYKDLYRFYRDFFIPNNPPSMRLRLISRTVGTDRIVDEMVCSFRHTQEIPWMLPGVKPTGREVEVAVVSIVCVRGRKLYHEHIYWDQATVLVQLGLIDGTKLPVVGREGARKVEDKGVVKSNLLIPGWVTEEEKEGSSKVEDDVKKLAEGVEEVELKN